MKKILFLFITTLFLINCKPIYKKMNIDKTLYEMEFMLKWKLPKEK